MTLFQRAGAVFPQRSEGSAPVFTPPQTQPLSSYPQNVRGAEFRQDGAESSTESEVPTLRCMFSLIFHQYLLSTNFLMREANIIF